MIVHAQAQRYIYPFFPSLYKLISSAIFVCGIAFAGVQSFCFVLAVVTGEWGPRDQSVSSWLIQIRSDQISSDIEKM